jgi:hypothetical protein
MVLDLFIYVGQAYLNPQTEEFAAMLEITNKINSDGQRIDGPI